MIKINKRLTGSVANLLGDMVVISLEGDLDHNKAVGPTVVLGLPTKRVNQLARKNVIESRVEVDHFHVVRKRV